MSQWNSVSAAHCWMEESSSPLDAAYSSCEALTRQHSKSFFIATQFLPKAKRRAVRALYAFCRTSDDIVDNPERTVGYSLSQWRQRAFVTPPDRSEPILTAWDDTRRRYQLSNAVIADLLDGMAMDLTIHRYDRFEQVERYCYHVASTVGLLSMQIIGYSEGAREPAIQMGVALQLTNILRDVGEDARRGRIYLPRDELHQFGLCEDDILAGCVDERYQRFMRFQIARVHRLYDEAWPGIARLHPDGRFAVAAAAAIYRAILSEIERNGYDNRTRRAVVPTRRKLSLLYGLWQQMRHMA